MRYKATLALAGLLITTSCTQFEVTYPDGTGVSTSGAPLVSRKDQFQVTHNWIDHVTGDKHETKVSRNTEEQTDSQTEMLRILAELSFAAGSAAVLAP